MKHVTDLSTDEQMVIKSRMTDLKLAAVQFAMHPHDTKLESLLLIAAHEFGVACDKAGMPNCWRDIFVDPSEMACQE